MADKMACPSCRRKTYHHVEVVTTIRTAHASPEDGGCVPAKVVQKTRQSWMSCITTRGGCGHRSDVRYEALDSDAES